jgi:LysR family transcriptional regulator of beta-lactamase
VREILTVGAVGTFAVGWLLPRLAAFRERHPYVEVRLSTNNNRVDLAAEGLDFAIRFGTGAWHGTDAVRLFEAPLSVLAVPAVARDLKEPADLLGLTLLRSYRRDEWTRWFEAAGLPRTPPPQNAVVFDTSLAMMEAVLQGVGVGLAPPLMFSRLLASGTVVQPFATSVALGSYWLTRLQSRSVTPAMSAFAGWLEETAAGEGLA